MSAARGSRPPLSPPPWRPQAPATIAVSLRPRGPLWCHVGLDVGRRLRLHAFHRHLAACGPVDSIEQEAPVVVHQHGIVEIDATKDERTASIIALVGPGRHLRPDAIAV